MNSLLILFITISVILPTISYVATDNFISAAIVLVVTALYLFLYAYQKVKMMMEENKKFHSCYTFINSFIISLSVNGSLLQSLESTKLLMDKEYSNIIDGLSNLNEMERLDYLKKYYDFDIYYLFLSVMKIYIEQGGDILKLSYYLIEESRRSEDYLIKCENISKRKIVEFTMLWVFTLLITIILRFTLNSFYHQITNFLLFQVAIVILFMLVIASIHLLIMKMIKVQVRGYRND